jgi:hypothetical protein
MCRNLTNASSDELMKQLANPNRHVRMNASRLLVDAAAKADEQTRNQMQAAGLQRLRQDWDKLNSDAKIAAMWTLKNSGYVGKELATPLQDSDPCGPAKCRIARGGLPSKGGGETWTDGRHVNPSSELTRALLSDSDAQVRVAALRAMAAGELSDEAARDLVAAWPKFDDDFQRSAAIGAGSRNAVAVIGAALDRP